MACTDPAPGPLLCTIGARAAALMRSLQGHGLPPEVVLEEAVSLLMVLRPAMPLPALRDEAARLAKTGGEAG